MWKVQLSYVIVRDFMMDFRRMAVVDQATAQEYLNTSKSPSKPTKINKDSIVDGKVTVEVQQSDSQYE